MLNQIGRRLTERLEFQGTAYKHRLLMLLDEFPSLGRLSFFEAELPYLAGYGIKCFLIAQSLNQIEKAYGANNAILDNCHVRVTYNALDERTAKRISELLGQATLLRRQRSFQGSAAWLSKVNHSEQEVGRALLMPDEILRLPYDEALLMVGGLPPYHAKKIMYYLDDRFRGRAWMKPPESSRARRAELPRSRADEWPKAPGGGEPLPPPPSILAPSSPTSPASPPMPATPPSVPMTEDQADFNQAMVDVMEQSNGSESADPSVDSPPMPPAADDAERSSATDAVAPDERVPV
jgi:type IV secretion system protein VirD4